jgi:hypothetical protein
MKVLDLKPGDSFGNVADAVPGVVEATAAKVVAGVKADYADSYPASLFKNLGKCRALATKLAA